LNGWLDPAVRVFHACAVAAQRTEEVGGRLRAVMPWLAEKGKGKGNETKYEYTYHSRKSELHFIWTLSAAQHPRNKDFSLSRDCASGRGIDENPPRCA
jgi:hypothetical protein